MAEGVLAPTLLTLFSFITVTHISKMHIQVRVIKMFRNYGESQETKKEISMNQAVQQI